MSLPPLMSRDCRGADAMLPVRRARAEVPVMVSRRRQGSRRAGRGRLRASAADREQVIEVLKVAFVQDRITEDELDQRIGKVLTYGPTTTGHPYRRYPRHPDKGTASRTRTTTRCHQEEGNPAHERRRRGHRFRDRRSVSAIL